MFCPQTLFLFALIRFVAVVKRSRNHAKFIRKMACNNTKIGSRRKYKVGGEVERRTALCDSVAAKTDMGHYSGWLYVGSEAEVMIYWCVVWGTLFWLPPVRLQNVWTVKYEWGIYNSRDCCPLNVRKSSFEKDIVQSYWMSRFQMAKSIAAIGHYDIPTNSRPTNRIIFKLPEWSHLVSAIRSHTSCLLSVCVIVLHARFYLSLALICTVM